MMATWRVLMRSPQRKAMLAALVVCLSMLGVGIALLMVARSARIAAQKQLVAVEASTAEIQERTAKLAPVLNDPEGLSQLYANMQANGVIGEPNRPRWLGALRQILDGGRWLQSRYLLGVGEDVALPAVSVAWLELLGETAPTLRGQPLTLTLEGTHAVEVLDVLQRLSRSQAPGFEIVGCDMKRRDDAFGSDTTCTLRWFSLYVAEVEAEAEPEPEPAQAAP